MLTSGRWWPAAFVDALITMLSLGFDPFIQQILSYPTRPTPVAGVVSLVTAQAFMVPADSELRDRANAGVF